MTARQSGSCALCVALLLVSTGLAAQLSRGRFLDNLDIRDTGHERDFILLERFRYLDPQGVTWLVPRGTVVNGASIPQPLWSIIGGPWDGPYRRASVIHDYFFRQKKYESAEVHRVFYDAMRTDNVNEVKAKLMYYAVVRFNRRWSEVEIDPFECNRKQAGAAGVPGGPLRCMPAPNDPSKHFRIRVDTVEVEFDRNDYDEVAKRLEAENLPTNEVARLAESNYAKAPKRVASVEFVDLR
jgi:hypothetical protein